MSEQTFADVLEEVGDLSVPGARERAVARMKLIEMKNRQSAVAEALRRGLPLRVERPGGVVQELAGFEHGQPVYFTTHNVNAAISTGANVLRNAPYALTGTGMTVGVWDGGSVRATHQEFATGSRAVVKDGSASIDHATHVGGTIAAAGVNANAKGMAPVATVDSYDWNSDITEMTARAAAAPAQSGMLYLSNHSYGYVSGWNYVGGAGSPARTWEWYGDGTTTAGYEYDFGRYNTYSRQSDALAFSAPYYLIFRSAGNERADNPTDGTAVALSPGSSTVVSYSSSTHPGGDGSYRGGFESMAFDALGKNVITVGSTSDAVSGGLRSVAAATVSYFSSWGPTDDGRIKPDIVANGDQLLSSLNGSDTSYGIYSGTSMATPNATGTAALIIQQYGQLFPGGAMRSSTLKSLLIHTADDRGNAGPDYKYGWGLVNGVAAADLIRDHAANPLKVRLNEGVITSTTTTVNHEFVWDGVSPIRATLAWTDPAGTATTTNDLRTPRLINNLQLKITGPAGSEHLPYVMPFVGTWTQASMDLPATTGVNNVDNVEQVYLAAPPVAGVYRCVVTYTGTLTNNTQNYSLLISGSANELPPPPPLSITSITPTTALPGAVTMDLAGVSFKTGAVVKLQRSGQSDITATSTTWNSTTSLRSQFDLTGAAAGTWSVRVTNPDSETTVLADAFTIVGALWSESFDGTLSGWTSQATTGSNAWSVVSTASHSPTKSYFAPGPATKTTCNLTSPSVSIPGNATNMQFTFWHSYNLQSARDGGKLEFSLDGGAWFDVTASGSGAAFASNGYNTTMSSGGKPADRSDFAGLPAWSGNSNGFIQTIINLTDTAKYAGHSLRARWRIATNVGTSSIGWYVDTIALTGGANQTNQAPVITIAADTASTESVTDPDSTIFEIVRGQDVQISVTASDDGGESALIYTWSGIHSGGIAPSFSINGTNASKTATVLFEATGDYLLTVVARDALGLQTSSSVNVRVLATATGISVTPASASITVGSTQAFAASQLDQFGQAVSPQPTSFTWTTSGGGSISSSTGTFTATSAGGPYIITATNASLSGIATLTVNPAPAAITLSNLTQSYDGTPKPITATTTPAGLSVSITYDGTSTAPTAAGSYAVLATITDPNYQGSATGTLVINQPPYNSWATANNLTGDAALPTADSDQDGVENLLEYATGMSPNLNDTLPISCALLTDSLAFTYTKNLSATDVSITIEWSDTLINDWSTAGVTSSVVSTDGSTQQIQAIIPVTSSTQRRFARMRVTQP
ncbi:MAG: S8 family serine peptidase [Verrucomicrobiaceae bacterium]|nr:S8 family serine peptidase [Verrucomicrobiaceae bacterium]